MPTAFNQEVIFSVTLSVWFFGIAVFKCKQMLRFKKDRCLALNFNSCHLGFVLSSVVVEFTPELASLLCQLAMLAYLVIYFHH